MRSFIRTFVLFIILCLIANFIINSLNLTYLNPYFAEKVDSYKTAELNKKVNTLFFGSSRTYRNVQPAVFDSIVGNSMRSYNLGAAAAYVPESYHLCEKFLEDKEESKNINLVFLEMAPFHEVAYTNLFSRQSYYWLSWKYVKLLQQYYSYKKVNPSERIVSTGKLYSSYLLNKFGFNYLLKKEQQDPKYSGPRNDGFYSLETQERYDAGITKRYKLFLKDTVPLYKRFMEAKNVFDKPFIKERKHYILHVDLIKSIIMELNSRNIRVCFVIPPRLLAEDYEELLYIKSQLSKGTIIDLGNPNLFPVFWRSKYSIDIGHMNDEGSFIYSCMLADSYSLLKKTSK